MVLDLEDGPRADERNLRSWLNGMSLRMLTRVCSARAIVVSRQLAVVAAKPGTAMASAIVAVTP